MIEEGLGGYKDHPEKIIMCAVSHYLVTDLKFALKYQELLSVQATQVFGKIMKRDPNLEKAFEDFGKEILEEQYSTFTKEQDSKV